MIRWSLKTGVPEDKIHGSKDFILLYYSIIKDQCFYIQNQCSEECFQNLKALFNLLFLTMVEVNGIEPMASCVQGRRSPS